MRTALAILMGTLSAALALANPLAARHGAPICPYGTAYSSMQCCAVNVADVVSLDCQPPGPLPSSAAEFKEICAKIGDKPQCCTLALAGQAVACQNPAGMDEDSGSSESESDSGSGGGGGDA
ncbi:hypothetical protein HFD88_009689 [Aspergillus terreus]|nr:hypothetical protein HFD88_009689 [Aspergillus terreus]